MDKSNLVDSKGNVLHLYLYSTDKKPAKGVIHLIHGASEHFARYGLFAEFLNKSGYEVVGIDFLGHGLSTSTNRYVHYADQGGSQLAYEGITLVQEYIKKRYPSLPVYLLGHSMGSFLARKAMIQTPNLYKKAIFSGTTYMPPFVSKGGMFLCKVIKRFHGPLHISPTIQNMAIDANPRKMRKDKIIGSRNAEWLTKDEAIQHYYESSPMCGQPFSVQANYDMFQWIDYVNHKKNIMKGNLESPIFFISGQNDSLGGYGKAVNKLANVYESIGYKHIKVKIYPHDRHEILNETDKEVVWKDVLSFIESR
jgi:alpha-beta hydrolase superfamily lysophospholipase